MFINSFPWLTQPWSRLQDRRRELPHALLIRGHSGLGKTMLARQFAQALLCERPAPEGLPCGTCPACNWFVLGNHPDFRQIEPDSLRTALPAEDERPKKASETVSRQIRIDQIRELQGFLAIGTHRGGLRVILVRPAEAMNVATANALLKSLEEPARGTVFLLVSSDPQRLLPTIRSRCQAIDVSPPERAMALAWLREQGVPEPETRLAYAGNAPLDVLERGEAAATVERLTAELARPDFDALAVADRCQGLEPVTIVDGLQKWVYDLARVGAGGAPRYHPRYDAVLRQLCTRCGPRALLRFGRELCRSRAVALHPLNPRLYMEDLFIRYQGLTEGADV